ncbi:MAG: 50S ribosomal protein L4 [Methanobacteriota archaeon]
MVAVYNTSGNSSGKVDLPEIFSTEYRPDLIQRAVVAIQAGRRQTFGPTHYAGLLTSADYFGRRRDVYRMTINKGMSRLPREKTGGGGLGKVRRVPQSVGGRRAHPPKPEKIYSKKINSKEYSLALKSAIAATAKKELVEKRGHIIPEKKDIPLITDDSIQKTSKSKELLEILNKLGFQPELERTGKTKPRSGKSRIRGRTSKKKTGVLIIVCEDEGIRKSASNITGVDVETVNSVNIEDLAPGTHAGRLVLWTKSAVEKIGEIV